jgi:predicted Rossmann fold flavoprotein
MHNIKLYDIVIIGAGASGLMTASLLDGRKLQICIIDSNSTIGAKIKVSGGGKCNITNNYLKSSKYLGDDKFIQNVFKQFDNNDLLSFLNTNNLFPKLNEKIVKGTYFCNSSNEVLSLFKNLTKNVHFKLNTKVTEVNYNNDYFNIQTSKNIINAKKIIVASGGKSFQNLGASEIGYKIAQNFRHKIVQLNPALVGFTVQKEQFWFKELSGLSLDVQIKVDDKTINGSMLFTHKGCSGPVILTTSLYWTKGKININFLPTKKSYLPKRFKKAIKELNINLTNYEMSPAGNYGYTKAEVTKGGVSTDEINPITMESKLQKNLYFLGEVIDVTGELGGYNFQWAFSSAFACSKNLNSKN